MIKFNKADLVVAAQEVKNSNFVGKTTSKLTKEIKNVSNETKIAETVSSQSAKVINFDKNIDNIKKNINNVAANNTYKNISCKQEMISEVIKDKYGQTIIVTSDVENLDDVIVTFMNTGKSFKCNAKELPDYGIHINQ